MFLYAPKTQTTMYLKGLEIRYDENGNLTRKGATSLTYDKENRLKILHLYAKKIRDPTNGGKIRKREKRRMGIRQGWALFEKITR